MHIAHCTALNSPGTSQIAFKFGYLPAKTITQIPWKQLQTIFNNISAFHTHVDSDPIQIQTLPHKTFYSTTDHDTASYVPLY